MKKVIGVFILLAYMVSNNSCQQEVLNIHQPNELKSYLVDENEESEYDQNIQKMAIALARSLKIKDLRKEIKEEAMLKVTGDYDIIWKNFKYRTIKTENGEMELTELLSEDIDQSNSKDEVKKKLATFGDTNKALQIAVPVHCEDWDIDNYIPLVTYLSFAYDERKVKEVTAYDSEGNIHQLSVDNEPENPVIVISRSERLDVNGNIKNSTPELSTINPIVKNQSGGTLKSAPAGPTSLTLSHGGANSVILQWSDVADETSYEIWRMYQPGETQFWQFATTTQNDNNYINNWIQEGAKVWYKVRALNNDGYSSWSPIMATTVSARNDNEWLKIKRMKFSSSLLRQVESWLSGAPEIRLRVVKGSETGASTSFTSSILEPWRRSDIDGVWWNQEVSILSWNTSTYGTVFTFDWREEDWDDNVTFTIDGNYEDKSDGGTIKYGGSVTISDNDGADIIGNTSVMWWHNKDQIYNLSGFEWQFVY